MIQRSMLVLADAALILAMWVCFANQSLAQANSTDQAFLGRWDLTLKTPSREYPSWLEISQEGGQFRARMVSRWGHARPLPKVEISKGHILFVSPKEEEDRKDDMVFEGKLSDGRLAGTTTVLMELHGNGQESERRSWKNTAHQDGGKRCSCLTAKA